MLLEERIVTCPACWEPVALELDLSVPAQEYIEDCQVCCRPMRIVYSVVDGELADLLVDRSD
jgi:uncharacterized protein YbaR (Trm112 family)